MEGSPSRRLLKALEEAASRIEELEQYQTEPIAIIGIGCRFPGNVHDSDSYWRFLCSGQDAIKAVPAKRWRTDEHAAARGGFLDDVEHFDHRFFGISPREAASMDPQQRLLLEVGWEALEDAGQTRERLAGSFTGVFIGITTSDYLQILRQNAAPEDVDGYFNTGNALNAAAGRLSYVLGLHGPSLVVDTACSSSLVAVHLACQNLRLRECDMALAGGVNLILSPDVSVAISRGGMLSPDGRCKTFDADADGYGRGEGCGVVVLKRFSDAVAANDPIAAVIRGSAVNQDGASGGFTVPNGSAQQALIRKALANARLTPAQIQYVEAHGTGTPLGDPIEVNAVGAVLREGRSPGHPFFLGSVKGNIGHLESAAGIAGLIKTALSVKNGWVLPHRPMRVPNPHIAWDTIPVQIPAEVVAWPGEEPRRAGVSSFGASGTNAHVILEQAPPRVSLAPLPARADRPLHLLALSAKDPEALRQLAASYSDFLVGNPDVSLPDLCWSANTGRSHFAYRIAIVGENATELRAELERSQSAGRVAEPQAPFCLVFHGNWVGMARELYEHQTAFRRTMDGRLQAAGLSMEEAVERSGGVFTDSVAVSLAALFQSWGIRPAFVAGAGTEEAADLFASTPGLFQVDLRPCESDSAVCRWRPVLRAVAELYVRGVFVDWQEFDSAYVRERIALPKYPWQRQRCWIDPAPARDPSAESRTLSLIRDGDSESLATSVTANGAFSRAERDLLPKLLRALIDQHRDQAQRGPEAFRDWLYQVEWELAPLYGREIQPGDVTSPNEVAEALSAKALELASDEALQPFYSVIRELEVLSRDYAWQALRDLGWQPPVGERFTTEQVGSYGRLLRRLLEILEETGVLARRGVQWEVLGQPKPRNLQHELEQLRLRCPEAKAELELLGRCGAALGSVMKGGTDGVQLLFAEGDLTTAASLYEDSPGARVMNSLVEKAVAGVLAKWPTGRGLRVLEIGAGTGGTTGHVLRSLRGGETEYTFSDISARFVREAEAKFGYWGTVRGEVLDIERNPADQGFAGRQYELIVASNVLHATRNLRESVQHVRELLAPGGALILLEGTAKVRFIDVIFGVTEGWWRFEDRDLRPEHPLLSTAQWTALLEQNGFAKAAAIGGDENAEGVLQRQAVIVAQAAESKPEPGSWLVLADEQGVGQELAVMLRELGHACTLAYAVTNDYERLLSDAGASLRGVVHLWSLDTDGPDKLTADGLREASEKNCGSALHLVQVLRARTNPPRLFFVTRGAKRPQRLSTCTGFAQSPLWGLGHIIALEHPELRPRCLDVEGFNVHDTARRLFDEITSSDPEHQVCIDGQGRYAARIVRHSAGTGYSPGQPISIYGDGTYLITGGLGGLGLLVADWLISCGATSLVLVGRNAPGPEANETLDAMAQRGVRLTAMQGDISAQSDISRILNRIALTLPPLRGIIHAAGLLDDAMLPQQNWTRFRRVLEPKIAGTWQLFRATEDLHLDFYVLFSSGAALLGSPGQANHAAANTFMDSFAQYLDARGTRCMSINWGAWSEVGAAAAHDVGERLRAGGLGAIPPTEGLRALAYLFENPSAQVGVIPILWGQFMHGKESIPLLAKFRKGASVAESRPSFSDELRSAPERKRRAIVASRIAEQIATVLAMKAPGKFDAQQGFFEMGMDSLTSMEFRNRLQKDLGIRLPNTLTFDYPTPEAVTEYVLQQAGFTSVEQSSADEVPPVIDNLSKEDLASMLDALILDVEGQSTTP